MDILFCNLGIAITYFSDGIKYSRTSRVCQSFPAVGSIAGELWKAGGLVADFPRETIGMLRRQKTIVLY